MVSFQCEGCGDVVKKPKLDKHGCGGPYTCIDCNKTFAGPAQYKSHTSCITEAEKYQKGLYKGPKGGKPNGANPRQKPNGTSHSPSHENQDTSSSAAPAPSTESKYDSQPRSQYPSRPTRPLQPSHSSPFYSPWGRSSFNRSYPRNPPPRYQPTGANNTPLGSPVRMSPVTVTPPNEEVGEDKTSSTNGGNGAEGSSVQSKDKKDKDKDKPKGKKRKTTAEDGPVALDDQPSEPKTKKTKLESDNQPEIPPTPAPSSPLKPAGDPPITKKRKDKKDKKGKDKKSGEREDKAGLKVVDDSTSKSSEGKDKKKKRDKKDKGKEKAEDDEPAPTSEHTPPKSSKKSKSVPTDSSAEAATKSKKRRRESAVVGGDDGPAANGAIQGDGPDVKERKTKERKSKTTDEVVEAGATGGSSAVKDKLSISVDGKKSKKERKEKKERKPKEAVASST